MRLLNNQVLHKNKAYLIFKNQKGAVKYGKIT